MNLEPLEVFALTSDMQRATGSIPYTSLMWNRKYYEVGDFLMEVPANVYDPSWAYIYTDERPETGIIQKVEYSDTSTVAGGVDTVILSGFFMESELNRYTFLVEETEEEAYRIYKPSPAKTKRPTMWSDNLGMTYVKTGDQWETIDGDYVDPSTINQSELSEIDVLLGDGMQRKMYPTSNTGKFPSGFWSTGEYSNSNYAYYSSDGKTLHSVAPDGTETTYGIVSGGGTGDVIYEDEDGFHWVNGVASSLNDTYVRAAEGWEHMVRSEGLEVVEGDNTIFGGSTYARAYRTVKGPWQLRTDLDVNEPADNVQRIIQWAQDIWGNNLLYDEVGFEGESKIIDPSLKLFGDLAYEELKTVGASPRLFYSFESDTCVFQVWRGLDRTQSQAGVPAPPTPDEPEPDEPTIDELYEAVDYIQSDGTQYIDTGFTPNQNTRVVAEAQLPSDGNPYNLFGDRKAYQSDAYGFLTFQGGYRADYGADTLTFSSSSLSGKFTVDFNKNVATLNGTDAVTFDSASFTCPGNLYVFGNNNNGAVSHQSSARLYRMEVYDNGTLVRNLMPYRRKADGVFGLLDLANDTFYESAGTEPFLAPGELPSGYTRLEYIESTGSQYINTGFKPNQDTSVVIDMQGGNSAAANGTQMFYGVGSQPYFQFGKSSSSNWGIRAYYNATYTDPLATWDQSSFKSTRRTISQNKNKIEVDGISHEFTYAAFTCAYTMYLFGVNSADGFKFATAMKVYSCRIGDNGTIVRDYVPVKNSSGEAGLFDLVTMTFFADAAGVGFVAGPEVAAVVEVAEVSTVALTRTVAASEESNTVANPFAVFSATWGTLYGFTASRDVSNYRNTCYVLYEFGTYTDSDGNIVGNRGFVKARLEDELPDAETYLDLRGEEPEEGQTDEAFIESLRQRGLAHLQANYAAIESLDTGTLTGNGYLEGYDLGDKVDMLVEAIGLVKEARITGVCEVHEAGSSTATLEIGEQKLTNIRKAVIV